MQHDYTETIKEHYKQIALKHGPSPDSTMADVTIRQRETDAVLRFVELVARKEGRPLRVADIGCGNGYTLERLHERFPEHTYVGVEFVDGMQRVAEERLAGTGIEIRHGDIRDADFTGGETFDVVILQRLLVNLLDAEDQRTGLNHCVEAVRPGGYLFAIEAFGPPLELLNEARAEVLLDPIPEAKNNLFLDMDFFEGQENLEPFAPEGWDFTPNELSTHYFVSRVFFPMATKGQPLKRNALFMLFFTEALEQGVGDYSPLLFLPFRRRD